MIRRNRVRSGLRWAALVAALGVVISCGGGGGDSKPIGTPQALEISPTVVLLRSATSTVQVTVTAITDTGRRIDFTAASEGTIYASSDPAVADVSSDGLVTAQGPGMASLAATNGTLSAMVEIYSDYAPPLLEGDFDLDPGEAPARKGKTLTIPLIAEAGGRVFGSYRVVVTWDATRYDFVKVEKGADLKAPLAVRSDTPGVAEMVGTYSPALGQSLTGRIEAARIVLRATGDPGQVSLIRGTVLGVSDDAFPASPLGLPTPRPFVSDHILIID